MELETENTMVLSEVTARAAQDVVTIAVALPSTFLFNRHKPSMPEMRFETPQAVRQATTEARRQLHARIVPVSVSKDGRIRINEKAMLPEREYSVRLGDDTYQFVKRADGVVVMYELI